MHERDGNPVTPAGGSIEDHVRSYYRLVDAGDVDALVALFTEDVVYQRPGYAEIRGNRRLAEFYRGERIIDHGHHTLSQVVVQDSHAAVQGEFAGLLKDGSEVNVRFADFFVAADSGRFSRRETFFFAPMV